MCRPALLVDLILVMALLSIILGAASSQAAADLPMPNQLILSLYIDQSGRCLINGYIDDPNSLPFLNSSEYSYEDESRQLYAITNSLTSKSADNWSVSFESEGIYEEFRIIFYLPADAKLSGVNSSQGLDYLIYASNRSVIAEVQGNDIIDPAVDIGYALHLADATSANADAFRAAGADSGSGEFNPGIHVTDYIAIALIIFLLTGLGLKIYFSRHRPKLARPEVSAAADEVFMGDKLSGHINPKRLIDRLTDSNLAGASDNNANTLSRLQEDPVKFGQNNPGGVDVRAGIEMNGDISAVMATLTDKEQSIFRGLLQRGGRMTQRDISYEMNISKSSLSGILTSMEKRKLITKREKGRTNIIELSERFLNNKERS